jgi:hypothetical protein
VTLPVMKFHILCKFKGPLLCSQEPATGRYPGALIQSTLSYPSLYPEVFRGFPQSLLADAGIVHYN